MRVKWSESRLPQIHLVMGVLMAGAGGEESVMEQAVKKFKQRGGQSNLK